MCVIKEKSEKAEKAHESSLFESFDKFGRFHKWQYFWICWPLIMTAMTHVNYIFVAENIDYRCKVPVCDNEDSSHHVPSWWPENVDNKCLRPVLDSATTDCSSPMFTNNSETCDEWIYENHNSIVSDFNLACEPWKANLVGTVHNAGMTASMLITGWLADSIGRKPTMILCSVGGAIGVVKMFITNYYGYLAVEFIESFFASGIYTVAVVLLIEVGDDTKRVLAGMIFSSAVYVGEVTFAFIAMALQRWKIVILAVYSPLLLFIFYGFLLREGIRWQITSGKIKQAKETLKKIAKINKLTISKEEIENINDEDVKSIYNMQTQQINESFKDVFRSREIKKRLAVSSYCFFTASFLYYGMMVHAVTLPGNKYINFILVCLAAVPGEMLAFYTFPRFGRRISLQFGFISSAFFLIAQFYTPDTLAWLKVGVFLMGKLGIVVCFTGIYTYSLELFPTSVRGSLVGIGNTAARIGSMISPLTPLLVMYLDVLPTMLFASTAVVAALLLTFTPETRTLPLFDTIAGIEGAKKKLQQKNCPY